MLGLGLLVAVTHYHERGTGRRICCTVVVGTLHLVFLPMVLVRRNQTVGVALYHVHGLKTSYPFSGTLVVSSRSGTSKDFHLDFLTLICNGASVSRMPDPLDSETSLSVRNLSYSAVEEARESPFGVASSHTLPSSALEANTSPFFFSDNALDYGTLTEIDNHAEVDTLRAPLSLRTELMLKAGEVERIRHGENTTKRF